MSALPPLITSLVTELVASGEVSAAVALTGTATRIDAQVAAGRTRSPDGRAVRPTDRFDLASMSKPFAATLALTLDDSGRLPLDTRLGDVWGDGIATRLADRTLESLLRHRSGLEAWAPLYRLCRSRAAVARYLLDGRALAARRERYSDLGLILWELSVERALCESYGRTLGRMVLRPLGLSGVGGPPGDHPSVVECRLGNEREVELAGEQGIPVGRLGGPAVGEVQDGNARFLGGPCAHAGLFGSAIHVYRLTSEWLAPGRLLSSAGVERALRGGRRYTLGWVRRTLRGSGGPHLSRAAFGHVGFTGGSVWADPEGDRIMVLLTHRVSTAVDLGPWRRRFHRTALETERNQALQ